MTQMALSAAITNGLDLVPPVIHHRRIFEFKGKDVIGADAIGTAICGLVGNAAEAAIASYQEPHFGPHNTACVAWPFLHEWCPYNCPDPTCLPIRTSRRWYQMLSHLQDTHHWSRERIAEWLASHHL